MIHDIQAELLRVHLDLSTVMLWLLCAPFYVTGYVVGALVRLVWWFVAAMVAGYKAGRQQ